MRQVVCTVLFLFLLLSGTLSFGQGVRVGPDGKVSKQTLSIPFPFFSEHFGFAAGYVCGVVGEPQDQSVLLATKMAGTKGIVIRVDTAASDEDARVQMMVNQPFQF